MNHYELKIMGAPQEMVERLSDVLFEGGALSITLTDEFDNPILEPPPGTMPLWPNVIITALYLEENTAHEVASLLREVIPNLTCEVQLLSEKDWEDAWMAHFKPMQFGRRLWIYPSSMKPEKEEGVFVLLNPGLAFGTGTHPTTRLCLTWLDANAKPNQTLIDYGSGSGILAISALKLGISKAFAVDIDPQALTATAYNAEENHIPSSSLIIEKPEALTVSADILIANILLSPLIELKASFKALLKDEGRLVVSGILKTQVDTLIEAYLGTFDVVSQADEEEWSLLVFRHSER